MKKVSIIMPVYNSEKYIKESLESIIHQTYKNWELIIVNEYGSNDKSIDIIKNYIKKDDRIKLIQNQKNEGIAESLNIGLRASDGEYIARMDADDISGIKRLEKQVNYLDKNKEIGLCGITPEFFGNQEISWEIETDPIKIKHNIFFYTPCVHPTIMFRREIIDKYNIFYNKKYKATEDYEFFSKVVGITNISNLEDKTLFKYRMYQDNATNRNNDIGTKLYNNIMKQNFINYLNLEFTNEEIELLNCHISIKKYRGKELYDKILELELLLKQILLACSKQNEFNTIDLYKTLHKRWMELKWTILPLEKEKNPMLQVILENSCFYREYLEESPCLEKNNPEITVLMPVYNSEKYIIDSVSSILNQSFKNLELMIILEYGTSDKSEEYLKLFKDKRIKIIKNEKKLGLALSLNKGIKLSTAKYIARMDADDLSESTRIEKQYNFLEKNEDVSLVCSWQKHFGDFGPVPYIYKTETDFNNLKAAMLFNCNICHSTVMFRRKTMIDNNYFYDENMAMEDFDLWNRMLEKEKFVCIPEVLGQYRRHEDNITNSKFDKVIESEINIISRNLENLKIMPKTYNKKLLIGWGNIYINNPELVPQAEELLSRILKQNKKLKIYNQKSLIKVVNKRKKWIEGKSVYIEYEKTQKNVKKIIKNFIKKLVKPIINPFYKRLMFRVDYRIETIVEERLRKYDKKISELDSIIEELQIQNNEMKQMLKKYKDK